MTFPLVEPSESMLEQMRRGERPHAGGYMSFIKWVHERALAPDPSHRADSLAEVEDVLMTQLEADGIRPALERPLESLVPFLFRVGQQSRLFQSCHDSSRVLRVDAGGAWFKMGNDEPADIRRRSSVRRIFVRLVEARCLSPGQGVPRDVLQREGWPDEVLVGSSGRARVHVAISTLRRLGLGDVLLHHQNGYMLDSTCELRLERPCEVEEGPYSEEAPPQVSRLQVAAGDAISV